MTYKFFFPKALVPKRSIQKLKEENLDIMEWETITPMVVRLLP